MQNKTKHLIEVLRGGRQCDADGSEIIMSRQACCEAADMLQGILEQGETHFDGFIREIEMANEIKPTEPKTIRVFTVDVRGCRECSRRVYDSTRGVSFCRDTYRSISDSKAASEILVQENLDELTPSCPRYAETKLIVKE